MRDIVLTLCAAFTSYCIAVLTLQYDNLPHHLKDVNDRVWGFALLIFWAVHYLERLIDAIKSQK